MKSVLATRAEDELYSTYLLRDEISAVVAVPGTVIYSNSRVNPGNDGMSVSSPGCRQRFFNCFDTFCSALGKPLYDVVAGYKAGKRSCPPHCKANNA